MWYRITIPTFYEKFRIIIWNYESIRICLYEQIRILMKNNNYKPTATELEILKVIWENGPSTVKQVNEVLNEIKETGYTTTLKMMQLMHEKGILSRNESSRSHVYDTNIKKYQAQNALIDNLLSSAFEGSAMKMVMQALGNKRTSKDELQKIKEYINSIEKGSK